MKSFLPSSAVVVGLVLLIGSFAWGILFPPSRTWTEEKSSRMAELGSQANLLKFSLVEAKNRPSIHSGKNPAEVQAEYDKVTAEYDQLKQEFASATNSPKTTATFLRWSGVAFIIAGAMVIMATRSA
jgi:hypothetical protein